MSIVTVRRSMRISFSTRGMTYVTPGPRGSTMRPRRKTTARSYSRRILIPLMSSMTTIIRTVAGGPKPNITPPLTPHLPLSSAAHFETQSVDAYDLHLFSGADRLFALRAPLLAVNKDPASRVERRPCLADLPYHAFAS